MDYFGIVKKAFHISWKHKFLWIFGLFVGGAASAKMINPIGYSFNSSDLSQNTNWANYTSSTGTFDCATFWANYGGMITALLTILVVFAIIFFVLNLISQGALIGSVEKIDSGEKSDFYHGFHLGSRQFWRIWGMHLTYLLMVLLSLIVLVVPVAVLIAAGQFAVAFILGLLLLLVCVLFWIMIAVLTPYSLRVIVLKKHGIFQSIRESLHLVRDNFLDVLIIYLILIGIGALVGVGFMLALFLVGAILFILGYGLFLLSSVVALIYGCVAALILLVFVILFNAAYNSFFSSIITLTYLKLAEK